MEGPLEYGPFVSLDVYIAKKSIMEVTEERSSKSTTPQNIVELPQRVNYGNCNWCGKLLEQPDNPFHAVVTGRWQADVVSYQLCKLCAVTAVHALEFGKQVTKECLEDGSSGKRIYVAVERVGQQENELVNALIWPDHPLGGNV